MKKFTPMLLLLFTGVSLFGQTVKGIVFQDKNNNGMPDTGEPRMENVAVSNGRDIALTDQNGKYSMKRIPGNPVFVIKPSGFISGKTIQSTLLFNAPDEVKEFNFAMYAHVEKEETEVVLLGDPQVDVMDDVYHVGRLVTEELIRDKPDLIIPLGDLSFDNTSIFPALSQTLGLVGSPVFYTIGNHDLDFGKPSFRDRDQSFEKTFGPSYYAFEFGEHLFLILNNIYPLQNRDYTGKLDLDQKAFIRNLVTLYSTRHKSINVFMHIPLEEMEDGEELLELLNPFEDVFIGAGHTHTQYHRYFERAGKSPVHELVAGAVCGAWWQGPRDLYGIPFALMYDGTPKGYWRMYLGKESRKLSYKVSGAPESKQMNIWVPEKRAWDIQLNALNDDHIYANIFAADADTHVEIRMDDQDWQVMDPYEGIAPYFKKLYFLQEKGRFESLGISKMPKPETESRHLWRWQIPQDLAPGIHKVHIRAVNTFLKLDTEENAVLWIL